MSKQNNILELNLKGEWFKMIEEGVKLEEYRDLSTYWYRRLMIYDEISGTQDFRTYTHIRFSNGYQPTRPQFDIELKGITIGTGKPEWGAEQGREYFVLQLGEISNRNNIWKPIYTEQQVLDIIDIWHASPLPFSSLPEYLGFTIEEYANYLTNGTIPLREA